MCLACGYLFAKKSGKLKTPGILQLRQKTGFKNFEKPEILNKITKKPGVLNIFYM